MPPIPNSSLPPTTDRPIPAPPESPPTRPRPSSPDAERSASSRTASSAGSEFAADPGPPFDPDAGPAAPDVDQPDWFEEPHWEESQVRDGLELQGEIVHGLVEWRLQLEDTQVWLHTKEDLRAIAPPLTRILNRYDVTRAAAAAGDEALLAAGLVRYATRNVVRTRREMTRRRPAEPQPVSGTPAEPDTGPEHDVEYQRVHGDPFSGPPNLTPKGTRH